MGQGRSISFILKKISEKFRYGLIWLLLRDYLMKVGIEITPFYWMKEAIPENIPAKLDGNSDDYEFSFFGAEEIKIINTLPEREYMGKKIIIEKFHKGKKCYGVKYKGKIAAFTWFDFDEGCGRLYPVKIKDNEVYLFDMYVLKDFRGKNIAPVLRYKSYEVLKEMGREICYSITECFNTPSVKFKEKLNAQFLLMGLHIRLFNKYRKNWILKRYPQKRREQLPSVGRA